ncbi:hypothetical protein AN958_12617 [Leucoagaricus sp. SymC.cos]|nr:hypothetical protein AN958_12617 [Leucoagaricus sp. SymC.cos]
MLQDDSSKIWIRYIGPFRQPLTSLSANRTACLRALQMRSHSRRWDEFTRSRKSTERHVGPYENEYAQLRQSQASARLQTSYTIIMKQIPSSVLLKNLALFCDYLEHPWVHDNQLSLFSSILCLSIPDLYIQHFIVYIQFPRF